MVFPIIRRVTDPLWRKRSRSLKKARRAFREGDPEGLHDLRVALRRTAATADALGKKRIVRKSKKIVRALSDLRQLEVDRGLLARVRELGWLPEDGASGLDARWSALFAADAKKATRAADGKEMRRLTQELKRRARAERRPPTTRLEKERARAERFLQPPPEGASDQQIHRYRLAVKRARYLAEDLSLAGAPGWDRAIDRERELQEELGHWNDARLFRKRLIEARAQSEERGAVSLALELDRAILTLEAVVLSARRRALEKARGDSRVRPIRQRGA
jgi:CHAD domain-containing protein